MAPDNPVTLRDVAAVAGVSLSTASKALNRTERISEATRQRVHEAAERLDFRPNALAQSFASGRSNTVGILTQKAHSTFSRPVLVGAIKELGLLDRAAVVYDAGESRVSWGTEQMRKLQARRVDGVLVIGAGHERMSRSLTERFSSPVAYTFADSDDPRDPTFQADNIGAGRIAVEHLLAGGRRRIAHLTASADSLAVQRREAGMRAALSSAGVEQVLPTIYGSWSHESGFAAAAALLDRDSTGRRVDAIFCGNDHITTGAMQLLEARGIRVPDDVALVGVDNWDDVVEQGPRRLTSVDLRLEELGAVGARFVATGEVRADCRLVPGASEQRRVLEPILVQGPTSDS